MDGKKALVWKYSLGVLLVGLLIMILYTQNAYIGEKEEKAIVKFVRKVSFLHFTAMQEFP